MSKGYFTPIQRPSLARRPLLVVGIPVALAIERLALVTPNARFHENVRPGPSFIKPPTRTVLHPCSILSPWVQRATVVNKRLKELRIISQALSVPKPLNLPDFKKLHYEYFDLLHELVVLPNFDWIDWGFPPANIHEIDMYSREIVQKHITRIVRSEKFVENAFNSAISSGVLPALSLRFCQLTNVQNKIKKCPVCNKRESVRKIQYGYPAFPVDEDIYALGGCVIFEDQPSFRCLECGEEF